MVSTSDRPRISLLTSFVRRLSEGALTAWGAVTFTFLALRLAAGDPVDALLSQGLTTLEQAERLRISLGYDLPVLRQYLLFLNGLLNGDLGRSLYTGLPVVEIVRSQLPSSLQLAAFSLLVAAGLGLVLGALSASARHPRARSIAAGLASLGVALPVATTAMISLILFSRLATGPTSLLNTALPALVLGYALAGPLARAIQAGLEQARTASYVRAARARGLGQRVFWHSLRPALPPVISLLALEAAFLIAGTVVIETVFGRPGLGRTLVQSVLQGDYPVAQGIVVVAALSYVASQVLGDSISAGFDPRLRSTRA